MVIRYTLNDQLDGSVIAAPFAPAVLVLAAEYSIHLVSLVAKHLSNEVVSFVVACDQQDRSLMWLQSLIDLILKFVNHRRLIFIHDHRICRQNLRCVPFMSERSNFPVPANPL